MVRLLIVSDIRLYREGIAEILDNNQQVSIVGTASNIQETIGRINGGSPDVVLVDLTMIDGMKVVSEIMSLYPAMKVVVLAVTEDDANVMACAKAGIVGYVSREASLEQLVTTVVGVERGELFCPRRIMATLLRNLKSGQHEDNETTESSHTNHELKENVLTKREREIISLLSDGLSNKDIARNLMIEVSTVKNHVHNILTKMGVQNRSQAVSLLQDKITFD